MSHSAENSLRLVRKNTWALLISWARTWARFWVSETYSKYSSIKRLSTLRIIILHRDTDLYRSHLVCSKLKLPQTRLLNVTLLFISDR